MLATSVNFRTAAARCVLGVAYTSYFSLLSDLKRGRFTYSLPDTISLSVGLLRTFMTLYKWCFYVLILYKNEH